MLYVIATPIGNLEDMSQRALRILKEVDLIVCEDTRVTKKLLSRYQISKPTLSYHQHSKLTKSKYILEQLAKGKNLALVSDAGTPTISDPGAKLISYLVKELPDLEIVSIPGPCALTAALSISGIPADKFIFLGFPPIKKKRNKFFQEVKDSKYPVVFYESPHRILKTLNELSVILNNSLVIASEAKQSRGKNKIAASPPAPHNDNRQIVVCRELTKKFEMTYRGKVKDIIQELEQDKIKGEFVVIINHD